MTTQKTFEDISKSINETYKRDTCGNCGQKIATSVSVTHHRYSRCDRCEELLCSKVCYDKHHETIHGAIVVQCFAKGEEDYSIKWLGTTTVKLLNEKTGHILVYKLTEHYNNCPCCEKLMHVYAIKGSTWLACCSEDCYNLYIGMRNLMGDAFSDDMIKKQNDE